MPATPLGDGPVRHIAVIGAGQSAKALVGAAAEMLSRGNRRLPRLRVTVFESGWEFGTGLAWSRRYALDEHLSSLAKPHSRVAFGDTQQVQFHRTVRLLSDAGVQVSLLPGRTVSSVEPRAYGVQITSTEIATGRRTHVDADFVVLATGHWRSPGALDGCPGYHPSPWPAAGLQDAVFGGRTDPPRVLILGAYLNGVDAALSLGFRAGRFAQDADGRQEYHGPEGLRIVIASRRGCLPKVWGRAPSPYTGQWCCEEALDRLLADPAHAGRLPLAPVFDLLMRELTGAEPRPRRRSTGQPSLGRLVKWLHRSRANTTPGRLRRDIAQVTSDARPWGTYARTIERGWQRVLFGTLPLFSEYSHALGAEDQAFFDREVRTTFFNYTMPMAIDNAVKLEAMMRSGHLSVMALGPSYRCRPRGQGARGLDLVLPNGGRERTMAFTDVVDAIGQTSDVRTHPSPLVRQLLRDGLAQPALRPFRCECAAARHATAAPADVVTRYGESYLVTGGLFVNPRTCELIPRGRFDDDPADTRGPHLYAMGPNLVGQFVDAQGIGHIERDARRILTSIARKLEGQSPGRP